MKPVSAIVRTVMVSAPERTARTAARVTTVTISPRMRFRFFVEALGKKARRSGSTMCAPDQGRPDFSEGLFDRRHMCGSEVSGRHGVLLLFGASALWLPSVGSASVRSCR